MEVQWLPTATTRPFRLGDSPSACAISASSSTSPRSSWLRSSAALDALSIATVSLWEKPGSDRLPPPPRLAAYARLFCTSRSFASGALRLLRDDELTEEERSREAELYEELLALRERAQSTGTAPVAREQHSSGRRSSIWHFPDGQAVSIVDVPMRPTRPPYADQSHLNYSRYARYRRP